MRFSFKRDRDYSLEDAHGEQARVISDLHERCFDQQWGTAEIANLLRQSGVICIVAKETGKPQLEPHAFIMVRMAADEAEILSIGVDPAQRRNGLAIKLIEEVNRRLHAERVKSLFLEVDFANVPAVNLYQKLRFETVAERPAYYKTPGGDKSAALVMRLDLV